MLQEMRGVLASVARWMRPVIAAKPGRIEDTEDSLRALSVAYTTALGYQITGPRLAAILDDAAAGAGIDQAALFLDIRDKEPLIEAHLATRRNAVTGAPWQLTSEKHQAQAEELAAELKAARVGALVEHLWDAVPTGYAGAVIDWTEGGKGIRGFVPIHPTAFEFDQAGNPAVSLIAGGTKGFGEFHPWQFAFLAHGGKPGIPTRTGLMRTLVWFWLLRNKGIKNWARFLEKYGIPFVAGKVPDALWGDATKRNELLAALKAIGSDGAGLTTESTAIEFLNAVQGSNADAFERFCRYVDELYTILILGQLATSDSGSGLSQGGMQEQVRQDLAAGDAAMLSQCIQDCVVLPLARMRWGWEDARDLVFEIDTSPARDLKSLADTYEVLTRVTGRHLDGAQIEAEFDVKLGKPVGGTATTGQDDDAKLVDLADSAGVRALDAVVADALRRTVEDPEGLAAWAAPVQDAIREAFGDLAPDDVEGFKTRIPRFLETLPGVLGEMDAASFESHLAGAMLAGIVNGYTSR